MIKQAQLNFKLGLTEDEITPRAGLAVYSEFLRWSLVGIAGKVVRHGRRLWLLLATTMEKLLLYHKMRKGCMAFG